MMKIGLLLLLILEIILQGSESKECSKPPISCDTTNYQSYVECERRRTKRNADCEEDSCSSCDCSTCNSSCENDSCNCCSSCCQSYHSCETNLCCHQTCRATCQHSSSCKSSCRKSCYNHVKSKSQNTNSSINNKDSHNVTTIIHLNNIINNTNVIDVPIVVNNTNVNNITLNTVEENVAYNPPLPPVPPPIYPQIIQPPQPPKGCCTLVGPRQCGPSPKFPFISCSHYKSEHCGSICKAPIMHAVPQQICSSIQPPSCQQQITYIPQPQPKCAYQSSWPFVSCGIQTNTNCDGCYDHYSSQTKQQGCSSSCYDQSFGSYYMPNQMYPNFGNYPGFGYGMGSPLGAGMPMFSSMMPNDFSSMGNSIYPLNYFMPNATEVQEKLYPGMHVIGTRGALFQSEDLFPSSKEPRSDKEESTEAKKLT